jgi:hypothetical protein
MKRDRRLGEDAPPGGRGLFPASSVCQALIYRSYEGILPCLMAVPEISAYHVLCSERKVRPACVRPVPQVGQHVFTRDVALHQIDCRPRILLGADG